MAEVFCQGVVSFVFLMHHRIVIDYQWFMS